MQIDDTRAQYSEEKKAKISKLEIDYKQLQERVFRHLHSRNSLSPKPLPDTVLAFQLQGLSCAADIGALVDALEAMGKIDRVDYVNCCVNRLAGLASALEKS